MQTPWSKAGTLHPPLALDKGSAGRHLLAVRWKRPLCLYSLVAMLWGVGHRAGGPEPWAVGAGVQRLDPSQGEETGMTSMTCLSHPS